MDWRQEAKEKLRNHEAKKNALKNIRAEIQNLKADFSGIHSSTADGTPVNGGGSTREDRLIGNISRRAELEKAHSLTKSAVDQVDGALDQLTVEERKILERLYMNPSKGNVLRLCEELNIEQATVYRWRDAALKRFTIALYGVTES